MAEPRRAPISHIADPNPPRAARISRGAGSVAAAREVGAAGDLDHFGADLSRDDEWRLHRHRPAGVVSCK
jgi:hypothetical protein